MKNMSKSTNHFLGRHLRPQFWGFKAANYFYNNCQSVIYRFFMAYYSEYPYQDYDSSDDRGCRFCLIMHLQLLWFTLNTSPERFHSRLVTQIENFDSYPIACPKIWSQRSELAANSLGHGWDQPNMIVANLHDWLTVFWWMLMVGQYFGTKVHANIWEGMNHRVSGLITNNGGVSNGMLVDA